ncbi:MAG: PaaX family transcriptional regulator [Myxococcota bacterium]
MQVTARSIITETLSVAESTGHPVVPVRTLIDACAIFGFSANTVRVTLVKMRADGTVESSERGTYELGEKSRELSQRIMGWRNVSDRTVPWDGSWVAVYVGHLTRSDRPALGRRTRALRLLGFRELEEGLFVRPNNFRGGVAEVRSALERLGVEPNAVCSRMDELSGRDNVRALNLWDATATMTGYRDLRDQLEESLRARESQPLVEAVREAFLLGREVIRWVTLDPLLPAEMAPTEERDDLVEAMREYDETGRVLWWRHMKLAADEVAA